MNKYDVKQTLEDYPLHVMEASRLGKKLRIVSDVDHIVIAGIGHSGIVGDLVQSLLIKDPTQVTVAREYKLPKNINNKTLVFILSYSGDSEEAIAMYSDALRKKAKVIIVTSGGKLSFLVHESNAKLIKIPSGLLSRFGLLLQLFPVLNVLIINKLTTLKQIDADELSNVLRNPLWQEKAEDIAKKLAGKIPLIYTTLNLQGVGKRWKAMFNENAKTHAFCNVFPEWNHNELQGFQHLHAKYHVIMIEDEKDSIRDQKRIKACKEILKSRGVPLTELRVRGVSLLSKTVTSLYLGDWVSYYLALKNKVDPGPLPITEELKKKIA